MSSLFHCSDVKRAGVTTLAMSDGINKTVLKLLGHAQKVGFHKVDHSIVCYYIEREIIIVQWELLK